MPGALGQVGERLAAGGDAAIHDRSAPPFGWCRHWNELYRPDYVFSGHLHRVPVTRGGPWAAQVPQTGTWCFNAGRINQDSGLVEVDTAQRTARWFPSWRREACRSLDLGRAAPANV